MSVPFYKKDKDLLVLMTGTAGDRAVGTHKIDSYLSRTYFDMLVDKLVEDPAAEIFENVMAEFAVAPNMDSIPDVKFYQYDLSKLFAAQNIMNPSYNKWAKDPAKAAGYAKASLIDLFQPEKSSGMMPNLQETVREEITGVMLFIPRTTETSNSKVMDPIMEQIAEAAGDRYYVIELTGRTTTGEDAELYVKGGLDSKGDTVKGQLELAKGKIPLIVSAGHIGSRSFSIPEINVVVLMYDGGSAATTGQNMSRGSTRGQRNDKVAHVISLSVDPTRDDSMVEAVLETASKVADKNDIDIVDATKLVLRSMNLHALNSAGDMVPVNPDDYAAKIISSRSLRKVVGATSNPALVMDNATSVQALLAMTGTEISLGKAESIGKKGKTFAENENGKVKVRNKDDSEEKEALKLWNEIRKAMKIIADNAEHMAAMAGHKKFTTALPAIANDNELSMLFEESFNITAEFVNELVVSKAINGKLLDLTVYTYSNEQAELAADIESFLENY